jgi:glucose/arabinose dehydrogenase
MLKSFPRLGFLCGAAIAAVAYAQPMAPGGMGYAAVNAYPNLTFQDPTVFIPEPGTNLIFVCEREGKIWYFANDPTTSTKTLFLDLSGQTQGYNDSGILGMAFHPQFGQAGSPNRGYFYIYYNYTPGPVVGSQAAPPSNLTPSYDRLSRFTVPDGTNVADPSSELVLVNQFDRDLWHNGGAMFFGPDGYLYFTNGDEGGSNNVYGQSQKINSGMFSGVFRIDVDMNPSTSHPIRRQPVPGISPPSGWPATYTANYYVPNDNPWQDPTGGTLEEFYALGFRSPHRMTLDAPTGNIWCADVGQSVSEEIDLIQAGGNYQWAYMEGTAAGPSPKPSPLIGTDSPPVYAYPHFNDNGCVIGGYVYRGSQLAPQLAGQYVFGDYDSNRVLAMTYNGAGNPVTVNYLATVPGLEKTQYTGGISTLGVDANGEIYICTIGPATSIYKLVPAGTDNYLTNISTRAYVGTGDNVLIAGFTVAGSGSENVLLRGVGPTLGQSPFNLSGVLGQPMINLTTGSGGAIATAGPWGGTTALSNAFAASGAFPLPADSADSALLASLPAGGYTSEVSGAGSTTGIALAEVYDAGGGSGSASLTNISSRASVGVGGNILIAGFVVEGTQPAQVLLRGIGPTLGTTFNVSGALAQPTITLYDSNGVPVQSNAGWGQDATLSAAFSSVGAFPLPQDSVDAAMVSVIPPGNYTIELSGIGGSTGVGLVEVYLMH